MTGFLSTKTRQLNYLHQFKKDKWKNEIKRKLALHEKCPYLELFWSSVFSRIRTEQGEIRSPYSFSMRNSTGQNSSQYGHFSRSVPQVVRWVLYAPTKILLLTFQRACETEMVLI